MLEDRNGSKLKVSLRFNPVPILIENASFLVLKEDFKFLSLKVVESLMIYRFSDFLDDTMTTSQMRNKAFLSSPFQYLLNFIKVSTKYPRCSIFSPVSATSSIMISRIVVFDEADVMFVYSFILH